MDDEKPLGELIGKMMSSYKLDKELDIRKIKSEWKDIVGEMIARGTKELWIKDKQLFIQITSAPLRSELQYHKKIILDKVNAYCGKEIIKTVIIQ